MHRDVRVRSSTTGTCTTAWSQMEDTSTGCLCCSCGRLLLPTPYPILGKMRPCWLALIHDDHTTTVEVYLKKN
jgi:hypothetical protein